MLSNGFDTPLHLELKPSWIFIQLQIIAHCVALFAIVSPSAMSVLVKTGLLIFVAGHFVLLLRDHLKLKNLQEKLVWQQGGDWLSIYNGVVEVWNNLPGSLITSWFVLIKLSNAKDTRTLLVFRDQCDTQTFRRLKVRLKYFQGEATIPTDAS